jgi:hypothetical protein
MSSTSPTIYTDITDPNNYDKPYNYTTMYVEFYIANYIVKVYINMVSIDILVNTAVAAYDTKTPPPPQNRCRHRATTKTRRRRKSTAATAALR